MHTVSEEMAIAVGDVVRLKSGGPWMTVQEISPIGNVIATVWFAPNSDAQSAVCTGEFPEQCLEKESNQEDRYGYRY